MKLNLIIGLLFVLPFFIKNAHSKRVAFEDGFIDGIADIKQLETSPFPAGEYYVSIYLNGEFVKKQYVTFNPQDNIDVCITTMLLKEIGVIVSSESNICNNFSKDLGLITNFNFYKKKLDIFVKNKFVTSKKTEIPPEHLWDDGANGLLINYYAYGNYNLKNTPKKSNSQYANFEPQLNIDAWRIKNQLVWSKEDKYNRLTSNYLYAERGINNIKSRIYIGSGYFPLRGFDSFKFKGGVLKTDESMYPSIEKNFSPVVKGIAKNQSKVEIYQDKAMIYTTTVPAGPFEITDYLLSGSNTDLYVKVIDTYGNIQTFIVPYSQPAVAVKNGYRYYEMAIGNYQELDEDFANFYSIVGLPYDVTVYGGGEFSPKFNSINMGLGKLIGDFGAISYAVTASETNIKNSKINNTSWNLKYNKYFDSTGTSLSLYYSGYSPNGFYSLKDYFHSHKNEECFFYNRKNDYGVSLSLLDGATLNLGAIKYWNGDKANNYTLTYTKSLFDGAVYFNTSITQNHMYNNKKTSKNTIVNTGVSIPLNFNSSNQQIAVSTVMSNNKYSSSNINVSGSSKDNKTFWNISQEFNDAESNTSVSSLLGGYKGKYAKLRGGYIKNNELQRVNGSIDGSFLLYKHGIVLGNSSGDTIAVIEAPGASNARINGLGGGETNFFGYALASYLEPYRENRISMDPLSLPSDISLDSTSTSVIPTKGAFIPAKFNTNRGKKVLFHLEDEYRKPIPFGAIVRVVSDSDNMSIVGDDGVVYLTAMKDTGVIEVVWGDRNHPKRKNIRYSLHHTPNPAGVYFAKTTIVQ